VRAEGEGEAATIISKALNKAGEGLVQFRRIEASKEIAATLAKVSPNPHFEEKGS
jgi:prohibitin 1